MITSWFYDGNSDWYAFGYADFLADSYKYIWAYTLLNLFFAHMLSTLKDGNFLPHIMNRAGLVYLGIISYGLYIFHNGFIWLIQTYFAELDLILQTIIAFTLTLLISALSYRFLEKPCLALKEQFFAKKQNS